MANRFLRRCNLILEGRSFTFNQSAQLFSDMMAWGIRETRKGNTVVFYGESGVARARFWNSVASPLLDFCSQENCFFKHAFGPILSYNTPEPADKPLPEGFQLAKKGFAFLAQGKYRPALIQFQKSMKWYEQNDVGVRLAKAGELVAHLKYSSEIENNIGYCLLKLRRPREALVHLLTSLEKAEDIFVNNNLADCYRLLGHDTLAKKHYSRELEINPGHPTARNSLLQLQEAV